MNLTIPRHRRPDWRTLGAAALATAGIALAAVAATAPPTTGSSTAVGAIAYSGTRPAQGGCHEYTAGSTGFEIGVCINDRATGTTAYPDIYVNKIGSHTGSCSIAIELWDANGARYGNTASAPCTAGEHPGNPYTVSKAVTLHAFARLQTNGTSYYFGGGQGDSPPVSLAPDANSTVYYNHDFLVARIDPATQLLEPVSSTVANVFKELHRCFNCSFPIPGAPQAFPADGQQLALHGLEWPASWLAGPALFYSQPSQNSFVVIAQDGHQDGGSAAVTFHFYIGSDGYLRLNVTAVGVHAVVWDWINQRVAYGFWDQFRQQLAVNLVKNGEGTYAPIH